jgi:hypothetical protein
MKEKFNPFPNTEATLYGDGRRIQIDAAMTPTPLDSKPQGAQDDILEFLYGAEPFEGVWWGEGKHPTRKGAYWWRSLLRERIEKLEREKQLHAGDTLSLSNELDEWKERAQDAERALAEARRDRDAAHKVIWALAKQAGGEVSVGYSTMLEMPLHPTIETYHDKESHRNVYRAIDATRQPEKDANNG